MCGNIGFPELLIILVFALLIFGHKRLPEVGKSLGKALRDFQRATSDIKGGAEKEIHSEESKSLNEGPTKDIKPVEEEKIPPLG